MKYKLVLSAVISLYGSSGFAQAPGIVYPAIQPSSPVKAALPQIPASSSKAVVPAVSASGARDAVNSPPAKTPSQIASDTASANVTPHNSPVKFVDPRRLDAASIEATQQESGRKPQITQTRKVLPRETVTANDQSSVSVKKNSDGSQVFRAQMPNNVAEAEAMVSAELAVPTYLPGQQKGPERSNLQVEKPDSILKSLDAKVLPKWVTSGINQVSSRNQILVLPGTTEIVRIARNFPNRFSTPFESAEVVTTDENLTHDGVGGAIILATASDKPIGIFIQDRNSDRAIALVLVPEDIPQRDIKLILDDSWGPPQLRNTPEASASGSVPSAQNDYVDYIKGIMRALAKSEVPDGHALSPIQQEFAPECQSPGLQIRLGQMLEGSKTRIAVYKASNPSPSAIPFQEAGCYRTGVLAVSSFPYPVLASGQDTEVYVVIRKDSIQDKSSSKRRPTLVAQ